MLHDLLSIRSVRDEPKEGAPFGEGVAAAYAWMMSKAKADGFEVFDADGFGGHIQWQGLTLDEAGEVIATADETLGIPVHLDVVPEGDGWSHEPYAGEISDGKVYGRGTLDNKGPACAIYIAIKALRDSGFVPAKNIRLILGLDEETGFGGMVKYLEMAGAPDFSFVPDADFPAINGEMGILDFELAKKLEKTKEKGLVLRSVKGGNASNMVPDFARAILQDQSGEGYDKVKDQLADFRYRTGYKVYGKGMGKAFEITAKGVSAHGAHPEKGRNAISVLMEFLSEVGVANESVRDFIEFYRGRIGFELHGDSLGIGLEDGPSGKLILNAGLIDMNADAGIITIGVRYPVTMGADAVYDAIAPLIDRYDLGLVKLKHLPPIYFEPDDPFIETLMEVYRNITGDNDSAPFVSGGGTYARSLPNAVAFGARFPDTPDLMHQKDECISIDELMLMAKIYAEAIKKLTSARSFSA